MRCDSEATGACNAPLRLAGRVYFVQKLDEALAEDGKNSAQVFFRAFADYIADAFSKIIGQFRHIHNASVVWIVESLFQPRHWRRKKNSVSGGHRIVQLSQSALRGQEPNLS